MAVDDAARLHLYEQARSTWGSDAADTLIDSMLTPTDRPATRDDLVAFSAEIRAEIAELRGELRSEIAELRGELCSEIAELRGDLRTEIAGVRGELHSEITGVRGDLHSEITGVRGDLHSEVTGVRGEIQDLRSEMYKGFADQTRRCFFGLVASNATLVGLVFAAVKLG